jgi:hypothetical protein
MSENDPTKLLEGSETFLKYNYYLDRFSQFAETKESWELALKEEIPLLIIEMIDAGIEFEDFVITLHQNSFKVKFSKNYNNYIDLVFKIVPFGQGMYGYVKKLSFEFEIDQKILEKRMHLLRQKEDLVFDPSYDPQNVDWSLIILKSLKDERESLVFDPNFDPQIMR